MTKIGWLIPFPFSCYYLRPIHGKVMALTTQEKTSRLLQQRVPSRCNRMHPD